MKHQHVHQSIEVASNSTPERQRLLLISAGVQGRLAEPVLQLPDMAGESWRFLEEVCRTFSPDLPAFPVLTAGLLR